MFVLTWEYFTNKALVPDIWAQLQHAEIFIWRWDRVIETIPFVNFLYFYSYLLPQAYKELNRRRVAKMDKVLIRASTVILLIYLPIGVFGYLTFADKLDSSLLSESTSGNILECDYKGSLSI